MADLTNALRVAGGGLLAAGALAVGAAAGAALERVVVRRAIGSSEPWMLDPLLSEETTVVTSDDVALHVEIDDADRSIEHPVTIVFAHGYALSLQSWALQRHALLGKARLVFYDQRSHGRSARAEFDSHHVDQLGDDLYRVITEVAPTGPLMLIGHSMGGMTIMALAEQHPDLFRERVYGVGLVSTSSGGMSDVTLGLPSAFAPAVQRLAPSITASLARRKDLVERTRRGGSDLALVLTRMYSFGSSASQEAGKFVAGMIEGTPIDVLAEFLPALLEHDKATALEQMQECEVLIVVGANDRLTPPEHSKTILRHIPGADLHVIPNAGHMANIEHAEIVNDLLLGLLSRVERNIAHVAA